MITTMFTNIATELAEVAQKVRKITVKVRGSSFGNGSGVIWQSSPFLRGTEGGSLIITNAHVATSRRAIVELWDGRLYEAVRTDIDPSKDLAALLIPATNLPSAIIANSDALRAGELVLAVGNPFADKGATTVGIIHANYQNVVMADIRLFPGNSGGALADCRGYVIGINTMIANGLAVAIPSATVERFSQAITAKIIRNS
jgi:serine protease Do